MKVEERTRLAGRMITVFGLAAAAVIGWMNPFGCGADDAAGEANLRTIDRESLAQVKNPKHALGILHHHDRRSRESREIAATLAFIQEKYGELVEVRQLDVRRDPELSRHEGAAGAPHVGMYFETRKVYEFAGVKPREEVDRKVEELIRGLIQRVGKDWLPPVEGMSRGGSGGDSARGPVIRRTPEPETTPRRP